MSKRRSKRRRKKRGLSLGESVATQKYCVKFQKTKGRFIFKKLVGTKETIACYFTTPQAALAEARELTTKRKNGYAEVTAAGSNLVFAYCGKGYCRVL